MYLIAERMRTLSPKGKQAIEMEGPRGGRRSSTNPAEKRQSASVQKSAEKWRRAAGKRASLVNGDSGAPRNSLMAGPGDG